MNADELMIGDWVLDGNVYAQVTSITCDGNIETTHNEHSNIDLVEPIPITTEILEKNSFGFIETNSEYRKMGGVWTGFWIYKNLELGVANLEHKGIFPCYINIQDLNIECKYVHQLQHALRLCGIEKEIIL